MAETVLVVEYGDFADTENATVPYLATKDQSARLYDMPSVPQVGLAGRTANLRIGKAVGGSSAVNGMAWDRGSAPDYDGWEALGNPGWGWEGLAKYFRRSSSFSPPADEYLSKYGYEWTDDAYGDGPIQVGYPSWQWPEAGELLFSLFRYRQGSSRTPADAGTAQNFTRMRGSQTWAFRT